MTQNNAGSAAVDDDRDEIDIGALVAQIWAGKYTILLFAFIAAIIGLLIAFSRDPVYQADALLQLETKAPSLALPAGLSGLVDNDPVTVTEIEIIRSRMILGQVVADLHLDWIATPRRLPALGSILLRYDVPLPESGLLLPFPRKGESIRLDYLELPPEWVGDDIVLTAGSGGDYSLALPDGSMVRGFVGETAIDRDLGYSVRIGELVAPAGRQFTIMQQSDAAAIDNLRNSLSASERGRGSAVLELRITSPDRDLAQRVLNAVTQSYLKQNIDRSTAEAESSLTFVEDQIPAAERAVTEAEAALNDFRQQQQTIDLSLETEGILTQTSLLEGELRELAAQEDELRQRYTPNHPTYQLLLEARARLEERLAVLRDEVGELPQTQREIINLSRTLELAQEVYVQLLNRSQELRVLRASSIGNVRIIDTARTSRFAIAPRKSIILALATIAGLMSGTALVLIRNWQRKGIQSSAELEKVGLPVFATINYSPIGAAIRGSRAFLPILAIKDPTDLAVEGFRSLRTSLHFGMLDAKTRSVAITSTAPGAGKSFTAVNLAAVAAQSGQTVCLIDADLRRGVLRRYFQMEKNRPGLADYLGGQATLDEVMVQGPVEGLTFISTGRFPPNPSELLLRSNFAELIDLLDKRFDLTLLDCPPVLAVTDPVIIGRLTGAIIGIIRHDVTPMGEIAAMQRTLETSGVRLAGAVLNGFDPRKVKAGSQNYSYRYDYKAHDA